MNATNLGQTADYLGLFSNFDFSNMFLHDHPPATKEWMSATQILGCKHALYWDILLPTLGIENANTTNIFADVGTHWHEYIFPKLLKRKFPVFQIVDCRKMKANEIVPKILVGGEGKVVYLEPRLGYKKENVFINGQIDALVTTNGTPKMIIDFKTTRRAPSLQKEMKWAKQVALYTKITNKVLKCRIKQVSNLVWDWQKFSNERYKKRMSATWDFIYEVDQNHNRFEVINEVVDNIYAALDVMKTCGLQEPAGMCQYCPHLLNCRNKNKRKVKLDADFFNVPSSDFRLVDLIPEEKLLGTRLADLCAIV